MGTLWHQTCEQSSQKMSFEDTIYLERICNTPFWNNSQTWNTTSPSLTPCFANTVLCWLPFAFLVVCFPYAAFDYLTAKRPPINWNRFNILKLLLTIILALIGLIHAILVSVWWFSDDSDISTDKILGVIITFLTYSLLITFVNAQRAFGFINGGAIWFYLFVQIICNLLTIPLKFPQRDSTFLYIELGMQILLFILCSFPDRIDNVVELFSSTNLYGEKCSQKNIKICPKETSSVPSKLTFWWFHSIAWLGFRRPLTKEDMWQIRVHDRATSLFERFNHFWQHKSFSNDFETNSTHIQSETKDKSDNYRLINDDIVSINSDCNSFSPERTKSPKSNLILIMAKQFWLYFLFPSVTRFATDILQLVNPIVMKYVIGFISDVHAPLWHGYFYTAIFVIINIVNSISSAYHQHRMSILGMRIRTCLTGALYRKSLVLAMHSKKDYTTGEIINLMAVDSQRFIDLLPWLCFLWTAPVQIGIAIWLLWAELGIAVLGGLLLMVVFIPIQGFAARFVKRIQAKQMKLKDKRLKAINEMLNGIKVLKLYAWEMAFIANIQAIRVQELKYIRLAGYITTIFNVISYCCPFMVTCFTFTLYIFIDEKNQLTAEKAFVSVALFNMLRIPMAQIPNIMTYLILTLVSVKRLNKFLNCDEIIPYVERVFDPTNAFTMSEASFNWEQVAVENSFKNYKHRSMTLANLNLKVTKGSLVAIVGSVGSGKSSLLHALLGEMQIQAGRVSISSDQQMAYVAQQAWIQNSTLRDNILFGSQLEADKYQKIIDACALRPDLEMLTAGDQTEIGEKGINLSGGQKQRVSIARACYSNANLYLFDDPLSAVDSHVGKHIFNEVFHSNTGILQGKTRILVTNALYMLPGVDQIVLIKSGAIEATGTYDQLMDQNSDFHELITNYTNSNLEDKEEEDINDELIKNERGLSQNEQLEQNCPDKSDIEDELFFDSTSNLKQLEEKSDSKPPKESKLVQAEHMETGQITLSVYMKYFKSLTLFGSIFILVLYALMVASSTGANMWLSVWTDDPNGDSRHYLLIYFVIGGMQLVFVCIGWIAIVTASQHSSRTLHQRLMEAIVHAPMYFFDTTPLGRIVNRFAKDIDVLDTQMGLIIRVVLNTTFNVLATIFIVCYQTPLFIAIVIPFVIVYLFIQRFYVSTSRQLKRLESVSRSPIFTHFSETLNGVCTIKAYNASHRFILESDHRVDENQRCCYPNMVAQCWLQVWLELLSNFLVFFASLFAVLSKLSGGGLSSSETGLSLSYALNITLYLNQCVRIFSNLENNIVSVERISEYTEVQPEAAWNKKEDDASVSQNWPENGEICFDGYGTRYRPGLDLVLRKIDFSTKKGEKIGIVGRTGAGKSSLTLALFRIIEPANGTIWMDGVDIGTLGLHTLRSRITIIPQDPVLFCGTIRANLDPFDQHTDEQLWSILELAHLKTFVSGLLQGLQHPIAEYGENLSLGQRQLICLARALLRRTKVLVLDEATAAVDLETDSLIQTTIRGHFAQCTVLTIAHRLNTILDSDRVMVLDAGKVAEFDTPTSLLANQKSIFYSLAKDAGIV